MGSPNLAQIGKFWHFWTLARRGPHRFLGVHTDSFEVPHRQFRGPHRLALVAKKFAVDGPRVAQTSNVRKYLKRSRGAKIEPNCPEVANLARMTHIRPKVHTTWPVDRLDLNAAFLEGLG